MSDVNTFIDTIGKDISETVSPKIQTLAEQITAQTFSQYGPRVPAFAGELVKDVIEEQSAAIRDFVTGLTPGDEHARWRHSRHARPGRRTHLRENGQSPVRVWKVVGRVDRSS